MARFRECRVWRQVGDYLVGARRLVEQVGVGAHVHLGDVEVGQVICYDD